LCKTFRLQDISVQNLQPAEMFQYKTFSE
jgi:hypothetical protein